jgi:hypothetical protein
MIDAPIEIATAQVGEAAEAAVSLVRSASSDQDEMVG